MKKLFLYLVVCCLLAACSSDELTTQKKSVTFNIPLTQEMMPFDATRASLADGSCTKLYVIVDGDLVETQISSEPDFGTPTLELDYGSHSISFVATVVEHSFASAVLSPTEGIVQDAFGKTISLTIDRSTTSQNVSLDRIICGMKFTVEDAIPTGCAKAKITMATHYKGISVSTLLGSASASYSREFNVSSKVGVTGITLTAYTYCPTVSEEWCSDATIEFQKADGTTIISHSLEDVSLNVNHITNVHGCFFARSPQATITINNTWGDVIEVEY